LFYHRGSLENIGSCGFLDYVFYTNVYGTTGTVKIQKKIKKKKNQVFSKTCKIRSPLG
jgi:hypothetical protein